MQVRISATPRARVGIHLHAGDLYRMGPKRRPGARFGAPGAPFFWRKAASRQLRRACVIGTALSYRSRSSLDHLLAERDTPANNPCTRARQAHPPGDRRPSAHRPDRGTRACECGSAGRSSDLSRRAAEFFGAAAWEVNPDVQVSSISDQNATENPRDPTRKMPPGAWDRRATHFLSLSNAPCLACSSTYFWNSAIL